jgi:hypothetical protein
MPTQIDEFGKCSESRHYKADQEITHKERPFEV